MSLIANDMEIILFKLLEKKRAKNLTISGMKNVQLTRKFTPAPIYF